MMKITPSAMTILLVTVAACACQARLDNEESTKWVTIDSAYSFNIWKSTFLYLFCGNDVQILKDNKGLSILKAQDILIPTDFTVQAAFIAEGQNNKRQYFGPSYGFYIDEATMKRRQLKYGSRRKFLQNGGPDAAGRKNGKVFFFKGCYMALRHSWTKWGAPQPMHSIGLPCDVDAAWSEKGGMVVLKGDQIWRWQKDGPVTGPTPFNKTYTLIDNWVLKPSPEETL